MGWFHRHHWTLVMAVRCCDCRWPSLDRAECIVPIGAYETAEAARIRLDGGNPPPPSPPFGLHAPSSPSYCEARVFERCTSCGVRRERRITQARPRRFNPWVDQGILPDIKPRTRVHHLGER